MGTRQSQLDEFDRVCNELMDETGMDLSDVVLELRNFMDQEHVLAGCTEFLQIRQSEILKAGNGE